MTTSKSSLLEAGLFLKDEFAVAHLKHLTPKTNGIGISKMWSTIFQNWPKYQEICPDSRLLKINKTVQIFYTSVNLKDKRKVDHILVSSLKVQSFFDAFYVIYQLSKINDDI